MIKLLVSILHDLFLKKMLNFKSENYFTKNSQLVVNMEHTDFRGCFKFRNPMKCKIIDEMQKIIVKKH
mgnify:CR=1 FL=1